MCVTAKQGSLCIFAADCGELGHLNHNLGRARIAPAQLDKRTKFDTYGLTAVAPKRRKPVPARFWRTTAGNEPVRDWLKSLPKADRQIIGDDLRLLQHGWPVGMPLCRSLGKGLSELRSALSSHRIARIFLTFFEGALILLHGFIKKDRKAPKEDLDLARKRLRDLKK